MASNINLDRNTAIRRVALLFAAYGAALGALTAMVSGFSAG